MSDTQKMIDEYSKDYCLCLEAAYGADMMSEGGAAAIDHMLSGIDLQGKQVLDIGAGLGGVAFYVAEQYQANVIGLELGEWMVSEANHRTPEALKKQVKFMTYNPPVLPFKDAEIDVIYSKGVLVHVQDKLPLFKEFFRVLKPGGIFVADDWLSPIQGQWGARLQKMCEMESLTLYAQLESDYWKVLQLSGFEAIEMRDENKHYQHYNQAIVDRLNQPEIAETVKQQFGEVFHQEAAEAYQLIADSIRDQELLIRWIRAHKPA